MKAFLLVSFPLFFFFQDCSQGLANHLAFCILQNGK